MENTRIAALLDEIADLLELMQDNVFRIRSYRNAAQTIRSLSESLTAMAQAGKDFSTLPNIGEGIAGKIREIIETGSCKRLDELRAKAPAGLTDLLRIPFFGPRTVMRLNQKLGIRSVDDLKKACLNHRVSALSGLGVKSEEKILAGIATIQKTTGRILYSEAIETLDDLGRHLDGLKSVTLWKAAGSFRRGLETIGDLDILVQARDREKAAGEILRHPEIAETLDRGRERLSVRLKSGLQVDFRFLEPEAFGSALMYFTGSKAHNIKLRRRAQDKRWKLNEYGLYAGDKRLSGETEEGVYKRLGLRWIPPELREDRGEIEAAEKNALPVLIDYLDIRGDFHAHTTASDGKDSIAVMAAAAKKLGWAFLAITDHSKRVTVAKGLDDDQALRHADNVRKIGDAMNGFWLMTGIEVDILKNGKLDLKEKTLAQLDWVVASVHVDRNMNRAAMTDRIVSAVKSGVIHSLGHPLDRLIRTREPLDIDLDKIIAACLAHGVRLEINGQPDRLDLPDTLCRHARDAGASFVMGTDAHAASQLGLMRLGLNVARRGWLSAKDVLNTRSLAQLR